MASDCPVNNYFFVRDKNDDSTLKAPMKNTKKFCGELHKNDACLMKFHAYEESN